MQRFCTVSALASCPWSLDAFNISLRQSYTLKLRGPSYSSYLFIAGNSLAIAACAVAMACMPSATGAFTHRTGNGQSSRNEKTFVVLIRVEFLLTLSVLWVWGGWVGGWVGGVQGGAGSSGGV